MKFGMKKFRPQNNRFYLSRKLVAVVTIFIFMASLLVVLTNFSINLIAASRDYTALISSWSEYYYKENLAIEKFGRTGDPAAFETYTLLKKDKTQLHEPINELFKPETDAKIIFSTLRSDEVYPNEISVLIAAFNWFYELDSIPNLKKNWERLNDIDDRQHQIVVKLYWEWESQKPHKKQINTYLTNINQLRKQWNRENKELMQQVGIASLEVKRFGLWISVILGILLVLIGIVVSVRANKSIGRWEHSLYEKEILLAEIHHRVKNNLAVISGLLELENLQNKNPEEALTESRNRIQSMAMIHEILYQSDSFSQIRLDTYVEELADYICKTYITKEQQVQLKTDLQKVTLNINQAVPVGLILNELLANAIEHGLDKSDKGILSIELNEKDGIIQLKIQDNGKGLPDNFDHKNTKSTGFTIINALIQQLEATLSVKTNSGATIVINFERSNSSGSSSALL